MQSREYNFNVINRINTRSSFYRYYLIFFVLGKELSLNTKSFHIIIHISLEMDRCWRISQAVCSLAARIRSREAIWSGENILESARFERIVTIPSIRETQDPRVSKIANVCHWELGRSLLPGWRRVSVSRWSGGSNTGLQVSHAPLSRHAHNIVFALSSMQYASHYWLVEMHSETRIVQQRNPHAASMGDHATFVFSRWYIDRRTCTSIGCRLDTRRSRRARLQHRFGSLAVRIRENFP